MNGKYPRYRQNRKRAGVFILILIFLILMGTTALSNALPNKTVYVAGDGNGDFNCDGSNDQVEINQALAYIAENPQFTTVHLKGPNTYVISNSIFIGSDTVLEGDPTAGIKPEDKAEWPSGKPLITQMDSAGNHDIIIRGFEIYGNHDNNKDKRKGEGYYNLIHFLRNGK